jgi:hypothetical protein
MLRHVKYYFFNTFLFSVTNYYIHEAETGVDPCPIARTCEVIGDWTDTA